MSPVSGCDQSVYLFSYCLSQFEKVWLTACGKEKQPLLKPRYQKDRLDFAQSYKEWTEKELYGLLRPKLIAWG